MNLRPLTFHFLLILIILGMSFSCRNGSTSRATQDALDNNLKSIDDILDEGITLLGIIESLNKAGADEIYSAVLSCKQCSRTHDVDVTFKGIDVPDRYVFGCGMDYKGYWRNLPQIYAVAES